MMNQDRYYGIFKGGEFFAINPLDPCEPPYSYEFPGDLKATGDILCWVKEPSLPDWALEKLNRQEGD